MAQEVEMTVSRGGSIRNASGGLQTDRTDAEGGGMGLRNQHVPQSHPSYNTSMSWRRVQLQDSKSGCLEPGLTPLD